MKIKIRKNQAEDRQNFKESKANAFFQPEAGRENSKKFDPLKARKESLPKKQAEKETMKRDEDQGLAKKIVDWIIKFSIYATIFFLPLFFLPTVSSALELNKQFLLVVLIGIGFLAWVGKMAWENKIKFKKIFILVPLLTFLGVMCLNAVFSVYSEVSFWGAEGEEHKSFISMIFFAALFILVLNNIKTKKEIFKVIFVLLASGFLVTLYGILQIWEIYIISGQAFQNPFFNTIGSVYVFEAYVAALFLICLALFLENINKIFKIILICLSFSFFFVLLVINLKIIWIALLTALALILGASTVKSGTKSSQARVLPMIFLVLALMAILINKPVLGKKQMPVEVYLNYKTSAKLMLSAWKENSLLGKGLGNYSIIYKENRPSNLGQFWSVNFNNGSSYFLTLATTTGILGALSFLFLVATGLFYLFRGVMLTTLKKKENNFMIIGVGAVWLFLTIIIFVYFTSIPIWMLWWLSLALLITFTCFENEEKESQEFVASSKNSRSSFSLSFAFVLIIIGLIVAIYMQSQKYMAAAYYYQALKMNAQNEKLEDVVNKISQAINTNPERDSYYRNMSVALFGLANQRVAEKGQEELSPEDSNYVSQMITESLKSADRAVQINDQNSQNYVSLANVYEGVMITMEKADERAIENYQKAIEHDPNNPALYVSIANIYVTLADVEAARQQQQQQAQQGQEQAMELPQKSREYLALARENAQKALEIKRDYVAANLLLPTIYQKEGDLAKAIEREKENKEIYPNDAGIDFRLGMLYYNNENFDNARKSFLDALALNKDYANARYFLALTYNKQGENDKALQQLKKVAETNQENENLKKMIENLENGRDIFEGLQQTQQNQPPVEEESGGNLPEQQPEIESGIENQEIPEEATPSAEEVEESSEEEIGPLPPEENQDKEEEKDEEE